MSMSFSHQTLGQRVHFGAGNLASDISAEAQRLSARRVMLIASGSAASAADRLAEVLPVVHRCDGARQHVPAEDAETAGRIAGQVDADLLVCLGGGSAIGLGKAIARDSKLPLIAAPTTYAGSEATNVWGITDQGRKTTGVDDAVLPRSVVYDVDLVATLPRSLSISSGLNAVAHCVDSLWVPHADPINAAWAEEALRALALGLVQITESPDASVGGAQQLQYGAYLAATAFSSAGSGLHHKICHVLGGSFGLPHAQTHAVMLPYVLAFNLDAAPAAGERIARALGGADALEALEQLRARIGAARTLEELGLREQDLQGAAAQVLDVVPASNPRDLDQDDATRLLHAAWAGANPAELRSHP